MVRFTVPPLRLTTVKALLTATLVIVLGSAVVVNPCMLGKLSTCSVVVCRVDGIHSSLSDEARIFSGVQYAVQWRLGTVGTRFGFLAGTFSSRILIIS